MFTVKQYLHSVKTFCAPHSRPGVCGLGMHKDLGEDTAGTTEPNRAKGYSRPYAVGEEGRRGDFQSGIICLPMPQLRVMEPCLPGGGRTWVSMGGDE